MGARAILARGRTTMICQVLHDHTTNRSAGQVENTGLVYARAVGDSDLLDGVKSGPRAAIWWTNPGPNKFHQGLASELLAPA